ncbi:MAG: hypothetical protein K2I22_12835 [Lachnospiraceae bacterium]|nr:hypothetical protein [Lachnospiraceae bacterium]
MDKIVLCFTLKNCQADFSALMQVVQAFEKDKNTDIINYEDILRKISIQYCWIKESEPYDYSPQEIVQRIEEHWNTNPYEDKSIWKVHGLTQLENMVSQREQYQISYYVRIKNAVEEDIKNIQYLLLVMQQFFSNPKSFSEKNRFLVFFEPFENYMSASKEQWDGVALYYRYSHFMRFILKHYNSIFYSAFFIGKKEKVVISPLSVRKIGIQSTFFPLIEVDSSIYTAFTRYCVLDSDGEPIGLEEGYASPELKDLLEISKRILDRRIGEDAKGREKEIITSNLYKYMSGEKFTALEYAVFSVLIPISAKLTEMDIENYHKRARSISSGLIQIIENVFLHSQNHKGIFTFRIIKDGKKHLNHILEGKYGGDLDRILEIDIADANIYETMLDNFTRKLENKDKYFSDINLSVSHFFQKFNGENEKAAWELYRSDNTSSCMGLARLEQELRVCKAVLKVRSSTQYSECAGSLVFRENNFNRAKFKNLEAQEGSIPGTQFQILFPILYSEEKKRHNANIFLNGFGSLEEKDVHYAEFVNYHSEPFTNDDLIDLDSRFYQSVCQEQVRDDMKDQMVCLWREEINRWNAKIKTKEEKVYYLDLSGIKNFEAPWAMETLCKGIVDSNILHNEKIQYIAMINCNKGFIEMMFETIMISNQNLMNDLQVYLHEENGLEDLVISGANQKDIIRNAIQYCHIKGKTLAFIEKYRGDIYDQENPVGKVQKLFPFDVTLCKSQQNDTTLFEEYISNISQCSLTATDEAGYWLHNIHMRLGNKVHLDEFYELSILFRKPRIARKIALLLIRKMIKEGLQIQNHFLFYGYASYSKEILTSLTEIVRFYQEKKKCSGYFVGFAVYQNDIMVHRTLTHINSKVKMYFSNEVPDDIEVKIVQIVPIISTLTTFKKMWDMFEENYPESAKRNHLVKNYTLFWVRDLQKANQMDLPTELEREYWEKIGENRTIETALINPYPQFFCYKTIKWYNPLKCEGCYPDNVLDERALVETDVTSTVPSQQLEVDFPLKVEERQSRRQIVNEIRLVHLEDCIFYGHICRDGNHFQYYVDTTQYFHQQKEYIARWLHNLQIEAKKEKIANVLNIIVSPQHHTNVEFGHYVNNYYFSGNADFIVIDSTKEYRSNIVVKYADVKAAIFAAIELDIKVQFAYVDDTIITGSTYRRANSLLHSLVPKKIQKPIQFDHVFVLVNRLSAYSKMDYVENVERDFHAFGDVNISSVRNFGDSCTMCTLQRNAKLFFKRSSTAAISGYWEKKQHHYEEVAFDRYTQIDDWRQKAKQGYLRALCSHYAKEHLIISEDYKESILGIITLLSDVIKIGKRNIEIDKAMLFEDEENINYFESEKLSPIYCCVFKKDVLATIKAYLKILCRPFFSYGKIYRQIILDFFIIMSQSFLDPAFDEKMLNGDVKISVVKKYLNDPGLRKEMAELCRFLKENMASAKERRDFVREYLLEGLTDLRSNYIIRKSTLDNYKALLEREDANYQEYCEYEKMVHRLINSSADETKSLWMEYLLVTGKENATNLNDLQSISVCEIDNGDDYGIFWTSLLIENTRLYYDSMLNFVQKASVFVKNENLEVEEAIKRSVDALWGDYYIRNLRRFVRLEILADSDFRTEEDIEKETRERVIKTASLLYLLKKETLRGIDRYDALKHRISDLLYEGDTLKILTSAFAGAQNSDELYAVTDYKKESVSTTVAQRVNNAIKSESLLNKSHYLGDDYIVLCVNNNEEYLRNEKVETSKHIKIQPLYFYIECNTNNFFKVIFRIRKILMYRHQLLHWIEADFNNNAMPILAEQMGINRQLTRERAGDHNTNTDILTIEKLLQSEYQEKYAEIYHLLLLKVYVNMRIARLFRSEWSKSAQDAYTLKKNEDKTNKAMKNLGEAFFRETLSGLSPKQYLMFVKDIFVFDMDILGESRKDVGILDLEESFGKLEGRCENDFYYKQEYIISIIFDILFTAMKMCRNWNVDIHEFFHREENNEIDSFFGNNETIAQYYILKKEKEKCRITVKTEEIPNQDVTYFVIKNKVCDVRKEDIETKNKEFKERMGAQETQGMSVQAMKWYTETLGSKNDIKAEFQYEWNEEKQEVEFVIKLPILSKERA